MKLLGTVRNKYDIRAAVLDMAQKKKQIIHGAQATNKQLPVNLRKKTVDYDVYTKKPEQSAKELAKKLSKQFKKKFEVSPGVHKGTFKVKDDKGETIADYTRVYRKPKTVNKFGIEYASTGYAKRKLKKLVKNEATEFRRDKDLDTLERIRKGERRFDF